MKQTLFLYLFVFSSAFGLAQVGINNSNPDDNSVLDLKATNKGLLIPRLTTTQREGMSSVKFSQGMMVYDTDLDILFVGYGKGVGATDNTKWYAMNPWKTEYKSNPAGTAVDMTTMTDTKSTHGNVGIGIPSPAEKLDVAGSVKATGLYITGKTKTRDLYVTGKVGIGTDSPAQELHIKGNVYADGGWARVSGNKGLYFETHQGGFHMTDAIWIRNWNDKGLNLDVGNNTKVALVTKGRIGVNTDTPKASLDVNGEVKIGNTSASCISTTAGSMRYNSTDKRIEFCNGTKWTSIKNKESRVYSAPYSQSSTTIPITEIEDICGDEDGCQVRIMMYNWDNTKRTASRSFLFFYNKSNKNWRIGEKGAHFAGTNNDATQSHINIFYSCHFTETKYINGTRYADDANLHILNWNQYNNETCKIKFYD